VTGTGRTGRRAAWSTDGVWVKRNFLPPFALVGVLDALDGLGPRWADSERLGLLGRGGVSQVRVDAEADRRRLDVVREALATAVLRWARSCGFQFAAPPALQLFPVRMKGDRQTAANQEPHVDELPGKSRPPICTSVFYARVRDIEGGALAVAPTLDRPGPVRVTPEANTIATFAGDRVHWVEPLHAGERLSVVVNFY